MKQLTFVLDEHLSPEDMGALVSAHPAYRNATSRLQIVLESSCDREYIQHHICEARKVLPGCTTVGMTTLGPVTDDMHFRQCTACSFLLFEEATTHVHAYDCHHMTAQDAGRQFCDELDELDDVKGILCVSSFVELELAPFIEQIAARYPHIPVFGTKAGTRKLGDDSSAIFAGESIYDRGILAVAFCGRDLHILTDLNLGWKPIGNDRIITSCDATGHVYTIDNKPAASIYQHYLNVTPDEHFFENVCSFPLLLEDGKQPIACVPYRHTPEGALQFPMRFEQGAHVRFSYAHPQYLLRNTMEAANRMSAFGSQALMLFACQNRRVFLGDRRADREFAFYRHACQNMVWAYGHGEVLKTSEGGGLLGSTIVAVGMREGPITRVANPLTETRSASSGATIPLSERLATFLDATTTELNQSISELETLAKRDPLTGVFNRRRMDELLHYEMSKRRKEDDFVLLMYDIDHFKQVNDTYGHDTGDIVLKDLTRCVLGCIREGDTLGRWGGEEFLCLLTNLSIDQAREVAERIRVRVQNTPFLRVGKITISIGITATRAEDTPQSFFQRVDKALYDAKHAGRNCVAVR